MGITNQASGLKPGVCTSTTRPSAPYEGMMIYETDTDMVAVYNGTAWRYISATTPTNGTVLQVQSTTVTSVVTISGSSTPANITGMSVSITPKSSSSKVLIIGAINIGGGSSSSLRTFVSLTGGNAGTGYRGDANGSNQRVAISSDQPVDTYGVRQYNLLYLDAPATTSATTYQVQAGSDGGSTTLYLNRGFYDNSGLTNVARSASTITAMEIAA